MWQVLSLSYAHKRPRRVTQRRRIVCSTCVGVNLCGKHAHLSLLGVLVSGQLQLHWIGNFHVKCNILYRCLAQILPADRYDSIALHDFPAFSRAAADHLRFALNFIVFAGSSHFPTNGALVQLLF